MQWPSFQYSCSHGGAPQAHNEKGKFKLCKQLGDVFQEYGTNGSGWNKEIQAKIEIQANSKQTCRQSITSVGSPLLPSKTRDEMDNTIGSNVCTSVKMMAYVHIQQLEE